MKKLTQTLATAENDKWLRVHFSQIFDSGSEPESKTQDPGGVDWLRHSRAVTTSVVDPYGTLKNIGFVFSLTVCTASALAVVFFRLLEPLTYVRFDLMKLMQVSLL